MSKLKYLFLLIYLIVGVVNVTSQHVNSLDEIDPLIKGSENKTMYDEQMNGVENPDELNMMLPSNLKVSDLKTLLQSDFERCHFTLKGCKKWPHKDNTYIVLGTCSFHIDYDKDLYLAMIYFDGDTLKKIAYGPHYEEVLDIEVDWSDSNCDFPMCLEESEVVLPNDYKKFDFAKYQISDQQTAFGVRCEWFEGYSGGGAFFQGLLLFVQEGDHIVNVFGQPMGYFKDVAGEWNDDGTREHFISQAENVLIMLTHKTNGYYDIKLQELDGGWSKVFAWDEVKHKYMIK